MIKYEDSSSQNPAAAEMGLPKFSICIPNYNYGHYIDETIQSVLNQTYPYFEIIVADNASTDKSVEVVQSFHDNRIRLVQNTFNVGFAPNLDKASQQATGDYFIMLSSDDIMKQGALEEYARVVQAFDGLNQDLFISSDIDIINGQGKVTGYKQGLNGELKKCLKQQVTFGTEASPGNYEECQGLDLLRGALQGSFVNIGQFLSTCYSKRLFDRVEGYRSVMSVIPDAHFSYKLMLQNPKVIFVKKALFQYRVHELGNYAQIQNNIKIYCDVYLLTQLLTEQELSKVDMSKREVQENFIRHWCLEKSFWRILTGKIAIAYRPCFFGMAAYPELMLRQPLFWAIPFIVLLYPAIWVTYKAWKAVKTKRQAISQ